MTTPIDRAARALALSQCGEDCFDALEPEAQEALRENVRAVLLAIREPSEGMGDAGRDVTGGYPYAPHEIPKLGYLQVHMIWHAMIDAALSE